MFKYSNEQALFVKSANNSEPLWFGVYVSRFEELNKMGILNIKTPSKTVKKNSRKNTTPKKVGRIVNIIERFQNRFVTDNGEETVPLPNYRGMSAKNLAFFMIIEEETGLYSEFLKARVTPEQMEEYKKELFAGLTKSQLDKLGVAVGEIIAEFQGIGARAEESA